MDISMHKIFIFLFVSSEDEEKAYSSYIDTPPPKGGGVSKPFFAIHFYNPMRDYQQLEPIALQ